MLESGFVHAPEDQLERYALGMVSSEEELAPLEEHLLVCPECQDKLREVETFIAHFRPVASRLRAEDARAVSQQTNPGRIRRAWDALRRFPAPLRVTVALAMATGIVFVVPRLSQHPASYEAVALEAVRGAGSASGSQTHLERIPQLEIDLTQLSAQSSWTVEVVDQTGGKIFETMVKSSGNRLQVNLDRPLPRGSYYVRLYGASRDELLREFGLESR